MRRHLAMHNQSIRRTTRTTGTRAILRISRPIPIIRLTCRTTVNKPAGRNKPIRRFPRRPRKRISRYKLVNDKFYRRPDKLPIPIKSGRWPEFRRRKRLKSRQRLWLIRLWHLRPLRIRERRWPRTRTTGSRPTRTTGRWTPPRLARQWPTRIRRGPTRRRRSRRRSRCSFRRSHLRSVHL